MVSRPSECQGGAGYGQPEFAAQIRLALENLHDYAYLQQLPLSSALIGSGETLDQSVRRLRATLLDAIEQLCPGSDVPPRAKERRPYDLLYGRYVQGMSTAELVEEMAISVRQLRREQKRALAALARLTWDLLSPYHRASEDASALTTVLPAGEGLAEDEAEQLIRQAQAEYLDLWPVVEGVLAVVKPVAEAREISLHSRPPEPLPAVLTNRVILRQTLMELVACAMDRAEGGEVVVGGMAAPEVGVWIRAKGAAPGTPVLEEARLDISRRLIVSQAGDLVIREGPGEWHATLTLPAAKDTPILVIDDSQGLVELFRRYTDGRHYRVLAATAADEAIRKARDVKPGLIILDIMVPQQDGWEILQCLRSADETRDTPIVICSVLNEPEIAASLGASGYLTKPVTQDALLTTVERYCRPSTALAAARKAVLSDNAGYPSG